MQASEPESFKGPLIYTPYISPLASYPGLRTMVNTVLPKKLNQSQYDAVLAIGESVRATRYDNRTKQREFLDEKTTAFVRLPLSRSSTNSYSIFIRRPSSHTLRTSPSTSLCMTSPMASRTPITRQLLATRSSPAVTQLSSILSRVSRLSVNGPRIPLSSVSKSTALNLRKHATQRLRLWRPSFRPPRRPRVLPRLPRRLNPRFEYSTLPLFDLTDFYSYRRKSRARLPSKTQTTLRSRMRTMLSKATVRPTTQWLSTVLTRCVF